MVVFDSADLDPTEEGVIDAVYFKKWAGGWGLIGVSFPVSLPSSTLSLFTLRLSFLLPSLYFLPLSPSPLSFLSLPLPFTSLLPCSLLLPSLSQSLLITSLSIFCNTLTLIIPSSLTHFLSLTFSLIHCLSPSFPPAISPFLPPSISLSLSPLLPPSLPPGMQCW